MIKNWENNKQDIFTMRQVYFVNITNFNLFNISIEIDNRKF